MTPLGRTPAAQAGRLAIGGTLCGMIQVPFRIETARLVLRCWSPADAPRVLASIGSSLDHLRAWMDWAKSEPESLERKERRLLRIRHDMQRGANFVYGIFDLEETEVLGGIGLHRRVGAGAGEIGYWIRAASINRGLCTEAAGALTRVAFTHLGLVRVEIHCDPRNAASAAIPRKLGYALQVLVPGRVLRQGAAPRDSMIWTLLNREYPTSPAASAVLAAYDEAARRLA
jgi:RimJ/RimL family protein N-acetyltransferase